MRPQKKDFLPDLQLKISSVDGEERKVTLPSVMGYELGPKVVTLTQCANSDAES
jgi:hypothetical protein